MADILLWKRVAGRWETLGSGDTINQTWLGAGINANKVADGSVSNAEYQRLAGVSSAIQTQLDGKQPLDAELTAIAGLTSAANKVPYFTGSGTAALQDFTSTGRSVVAAANAQGVLTAIGVTALVAELNYMGGVTSAVQTQLDSKATGDYSITSSAGSSTTKGAAVYIHTDGTFKKAQANSTTTADAFGLAVTTIANSAAGMIRRFGPMTMLTTDWDAITGDSGGLTAGSKYWVSDATAGNLTKTNPAATGKQEKLMGLALSTTTLFIIPDTMYAYA